MLKIMGSKIFIIYAEFFFYLSKPMKIRFEDVSNTCKRMRRSLKYYREFFSALVESWKKLKTSNVFSSFSVC